MWSMDPWGVPETLISGGGPWGQNYFILEAICFFHCVDICTDGAKAMVGKTVDALAWIKAEAFN